MTTLRAGLASVSALLTLLVAGARPASAQLPPIVPPDSSGVFARVETDKLVYAQDEPIQITVHAVNASPDSVRLDFMDSCHAAYSVDDAYHSISHVGCLMVLTHIVLGPGEDRVLGRFTHTAEMYPVGPGVHIIEGEILGYAKDAVRIHVEGNTTPQFTVNAWVTPRSARVGEPVGFHFTVTNTGGAPASFVVDGCPVHYTIDGVFTPNWACAEFARQITLAPGESITFDPSNDPPLLHDPAVYPLGPGAHSATLWIRGVGRAEAPFAVESLDPTVAALAGVVVDEPGYPILDGVAILSHSVNDSILVPSEAPEYGAPIGGAGWFLFPNVSPGRYYLRVEVTSLWSSSGLEAREVVWYPGVTDPALAQPIDLAAGVYRGDVKLPLPGVTPPPPPEAYAIDGSVFGMSALPEGVPLAGATVVAVPVVYTRNDSLPPDVPGADGSTDPSLPPEPGRFVAITGADGRFHMDVTSGTYRLIAGRGGSHRYQYWDHEDMLSGARLMVVPDPTADAARVSLSPRFDLAPLDATSPSAIAGTVLAMDPVNDGPPQPLADASVIAIPIVPDMTASRIGYSTTTGEDGRFLLDVPPTSPYIVRVSRDGYSDQYFGGFRDDGARWVDVAPGQTTDGIDFILQPVTPPGPNGIIEGWVYRGDVRCADEAGERCLVPAVGAIVRISAAYPTFAPYEVRTVVDADGHFVVDGLTAAEDGSLAYYVSAQLDGYAPAYYPDGVAFEEALPLSVFPGVPVSAGNIFVARKVTPPGGGFVYGGVADGLGAPIPGALVKVFTDPDNPYGPVFTVMANSDGRFHVSGLPAGVPVLVSAEAEGFVPAYYPGMYKWESAQRVYTGGPAIDVLPVEMTLRAALGGGPYIQAARVRVAVEDSSAVGGGDGGADSTGTVEPGTGFGRDAVRLKIMAWHRENLRGAFFYLVNPLSMSPMEIPVSGGVSGDNGTLVLTGLPAGVYTAYADRPGYSTAYFSVEADGSPTTIALDNHTPAVLADIRLAPKGGVPPIGDGDDDGARMVSYLGNAPNPFRPQTTIGYRLEQDCPVTLRVFDYQGRLVRTLAAAETQAAGLHEKVWDGCDDRGRRVSAGVYFYRITAESYERAQRMVLLP